VGDGVGRGAVSRLRLAAIHSKPSLPCRNAWAIANGTLASAFTTSARISSTRARFSYSTATAIARRSSALACAIRLSASA
jgi:hypothetical protein